MLYIPFQFNAVSAIDSVNCIGAYCADIIHLYTLYILGKNGIDQ